LPPQFGDPKTLRPGADITPFPPSYATLGKSESSQPWLLESIVTQA